MARVQCTCCVCGRRIERWPSDIPAGGRVYCGSACYTRAKRAAVGEKAGGWRGGPVRLICTVCGKVFESCVAEASRRRTCGSACRAESLRGRFVGPLSPKWRGGYRRPDGYWVVTIAGVGRVRRNRLAYEQAHGPIPPGMIVHHIDGDKANDDPANLTLLTRTEHMRLHKPHP